MDPIKKAAQNLCSRCMLSNVCLPSGLAPHERIQFENIYKKSLILPPKKTIYLPESPFKYLYILQSGSAKSYTLSSQGEEHITDFYFPGDFLGMESIHTGCYTTCAVTLQTTTLCVIPFIELIALSSRIPNLFQQMLKFLSKKLDEQISRNAHPNAEEKVATFLTQLGDRFQHLGYMSNEYHLSMTRQEIGNYLGLATETVSRVFSHLQKTGMVEVERRHIFLDKEKLCAFYDIENSS
ncbi:MAG: helix-turn-helix domain-containing protein [Gammaproteobacteria bacterium]